MKNLWALRYVLANLLLIAVVGILLVSAVRHFPQYVAAGIFLLALFVVLNRPRVIRERVRLIEAAESAFQSAYSELSPIPQLEESSSYGFPVFTVTFASKRQMEAAAVQIEAFKREIDQIFSHQSRWISLWHREPFSAEKAVCLLCKKEPNQPPEPMSGLAPGHGSS